MLLDAGADPDIHDDKYDATVLGWAEFCGQDQIAGSCASAAGEVRSGEVCGSPAGRDASAGKPLAAERAWF